MVLWCFHDETDSERYTWRWCFCGDSFWWSHPLVRFVHEIVQNDQVCISGVEGVQVRQSLLKVHPIYGSVQSLVFSITPQDAIQDLGHHMSDIVYEFPEKDGFSTSGWSRDHTGKWMDPRHEMVWIVFIGNVKCVRIAGLYHVIRFFCLPLYFVLVCKESILLLLLLWGKNIWLLLLLWGNRVWLLLLLWGKRLWLLLLLLWGKRVRIWWRMLLLLWGKRVWLLLLKCRLLLTVSAF